MTIFPKWYAYNNDDPELYPFQSSHERIGADPEAPPAEAPPRQKRPPPMLLPMTRAHS